MSVTKFREKGAHSVDGILSHYGKKGMRWGVRTTWGTGSGSSGPKVGIREGVSLPKNLRTHFRGPASNVSADAAAAKVIGSKLKKGGTKALSNEELQKYALRLNLEKQVTMQMPAGSPGKAFVKTMMTQVAKQQVTRLANDSATKSIDALMKKTHKLGSPVKQ